MSTHNIHHLGLAVKNLNDTTRFFTEVLGWQVVHELPDYPAKFVSNGDAFITLWQTDDDAKDFDKRANVGLHHFAIRVDSEESLHALFKKAMGHPGVRIEFAPELMGEGPSMHCMLFEPGGIRMEFAYSP